MVAGCTNRFEAGFDMDIEYCGDLQFVGNAMMLIGITAGVVVLTCLFIIYSEARQVYWLYKNCREGEI